MNLQVAITIHSLSAVLSSHQLGHNLHFYLESHAFVPPRGHADRECFLLDYTLPLLSAAFLIETLELWCYWDSTLDGAIGCAKSFIIMPVMDIEGRSGKKFPQKNSLKDK